MDTERGKISFLTAASIIFLSSGMVIHVIDIPIILDAAGKDAWISVLIASPIYLLWIVFLKKFINYLNGEPIINWVRKHWGKAGYSLFTTVMLCILIFNILHTMQDTMIWSTSTYLQGTPPLVICLFILFICLLVALSGLQSLAVTAGILLPIVSFFGFFVATSNQKHKDYTLLLPILENGLQSPIIGAYYALAALFDSLMFIFIAHTFKKKVTYKHTIGFSLYLVMIFIGPIVGGITEFGIVEAAAQRYSVFDQWKILGLGHLLQHVDFLSIFQWLSGSVIRIGYLLFIITKLLTIHKKNQKAIFAIVTTILIGLSTLINWRADTSFIVLTNYYLPLFVIFIPFISIAFWITYLLTRHKQVTPSNIYEQSLQGGEETHGDKGNE